MLEDIQVPTGMLPKAFINPNPRKRSRYAKLKTPKTTEISMRPENGELA